MISKHFYIVMLAVLVWSLGGHAYAEDPPEGLDFVGGYFENGVYKCYKEPCFSLHKRKYPGANNIKFKEHAWPFWLDIDQNCQKENVQAIAEASLVDTAHKDGDTCQEVTAGEWLDPYTGQTITDATKITVDRRVSLEEAHSVGGFAWARNKRALFANSPENLIVVSTEHKEARDGRSSVEWMPPNKRFWCDYVIHRERLFRKFGLPIKDDQQAHNQEIKKLYCKY